MGSWPGLDWMLEHEMLLMEWRTMRGAWNVSSNKCVIGELDFLQGFSQLIFSDKVFQQDYMSGSSVVMMMDSTFNFPSPPHRPLISSHFSFSCPSHHQHGPMASLRRNLIIREETHFLRTIHFPFRLSSQARTTNIPPVERGYEFSIPQQEWAAKAIPLLN